MLEAFELSKHYGNQRALDTLTLPVAPGEIDCLLGGNATSLSLPVLLLAIAGCRRMRGIGVKVGA